MVYNLTICAGDKIEHEQSKDCFTINVEMTIKLTKQHNVWNNINK